MIRKIFKTGHSAAVTISGKLLSQMGLKMGDDVKIESTGEGVLTIKPAKRQNQLTLDLKVRPKLGAKN